MIGVAILILLPTRSFFLNKRTVYLVTPTSSWPGTAVVTKALQAEWIHPMWTLALICILERWVTLKSLTNSPYMFCYTQCFIGSIRDLFLGHQKSSFMFKGAPSTLPLGWQEGEKRRSFFFFMKGSQGSGMTFLLYRVSTCLKSLISSGLLIFFLLVSFLSAICWLLWLCVCCE